MEHSDAVAGPPGPETDFSICQQEAALLSKLQKIADSYANKNDDSPIQGVRVVYFNSSSEDIAIQCCDHHDEHKDQWKEALTDHCLEAGTITSFDTKSGVTTVQWDCGTKRSYPYRKWCHLRAYRLGPAGYLGQMIYCDKCLEPSKGFVFRLIETSKTGMECYDVCVKCYIEVDEYKDRCFQCLIPSEDIYEQLRKSKEVCSPPRTKSDMYKILGIFKGADVEYSVDNGIQSGEVVRIVHGPDGCHDLRTARHYESCAEINPSETGLETAKKASLVYRKAGSRGEVELKAVKPGVDSSNVPIKHFPVLGDRVVLELFECKQKIHKVEKSDSSCEYFIRYRDGHSDCIVINGGNIECITDSQIWDKCQNIKAIVIILSDLDTLPGGLENFADSVELVSLQHNKFTTFPRVLLKLPKVRHLVLFGNQVSIYPGEDLIRLAKLERVKFGLNEIKSLPNVFASFEFLTDMMLDNNVLARLPPSFAHLKQLERLDLTNNCFTCIPNPLLELLKLKFLYMRYNRIHRLSPLEDEDGVKTYELLMRLKILSLRGNPVYIQLNYETGVTVFKDEREKFFKLDQIPGPVPKALRVLVLGKSGAGKTSIVDALSLEKYVTPILEANHDPTIGIKQFSMPLKMKDKADKDVIIELRLWDFAGQESYLMMNSLFVTDGTLIWIAVNFNEYDEKSEKSFNQHIGIWLQQVMTAMTKTVKPVVWIICTHTDKCTQNQIDTKRAHINERIKQEFEAFEKKIDKELSELRKIEPTQQYRSPFCVQKSISNLEELKQSEASAFITNNLQIICLNSNYGFSGYDSLHKYIKLIPQMPSFEWLSVQLTIEQQKADDKLRQKAEEMLSRGEAPILSKDDDVFDRIRNDGDFFKYVHQIGEILVSKSGLSETVLLHTEWLINLLQKIFHHDFEAMIHEKLKTGLFRCMDQEEVDKHLRRLRATGIVSDRLLEELWGLKEKMNEVTEFLESCGIMYKIAGSPDSPGYLFPWLMVKKQFGQPTPNLTNRDTHILVCYRFFPCVPTCFIQELAVHCQRALQRVSIEEIYQNAFIMQTKKDSNDISVTVSTVQQDRSLCGKVYLLVASDVVQDLERLAPSLWFIIMQIIKEMEAMLASWAFYSSLQRSVYCTSCGSHYWSLEIKKDDSHDSKTLSYPYKCDIPRCKETSPICLMVPPTDLLIQQDEYTDRDVRYGCQPLSPDHEESSASVFTTHPVNPITLTAVSDPSPLREEGTDDGVLV